MALPLHLRIDPRTRTRSHKDGTLPVSAIEHRGDRKDLMRSIIRLREVKLVMDSLEKERAELNTRIGEILDGHGFESLKHHDMKVTRITSSRATLKRELLLENGVGPEIIEKSTVTTEYKYVRLDVDKEDAA